MRHDVCALSDLSVEGMTEVEAQGLKILLLREPGDRVQALGGLCPHKGAPLKDGMRVGSKLICPWHHAIFDVATGDHLEPPGKGCLNRFAASVEDGRVFVEIAEGQGLHRPEVEAAQRRRGGDKLFAIVGAGAAGLACAEELVKLGFDGRIVMISPEAEPPYDRTDLSKTYLAGKLPDEKLPLAAPEALDGLGIERRTATVTRVDPSAREIRFTVGEPLRFDRCFVAPGSAAARPNLPGLDLDGVHVLRSHCDAAALKAALPRARHIVVVGAGFIGMEAAAQLATLGKRVTVIARDKIPFVRQFGPDVAGQIADQHKEKGVAIQGGQEVESLKGADGRVAAVRLKSGQEIEADLVLVAVGAAPRAKLLDPEAGKGVAVDAFLEFAPGVHAGGDIAAVPLPGRMKPLRIEHWRVAEQHGRQAARAMLGEAEPFAGIPFSWTAQFDRVSYLGHADSADEVHIEGDLAAGSYTAFYVERGTVTAAIGRGKGDRTPALHALMLSDPTPSRASLESVGWAPEKLLRG
ncbi:pyridine nucleotide-disulfide oxidoreductase [Aureimonas endophytica]|uniref:Pyridine nucleotide-disulfide oxidoreductase n=1 Tax=Aureimonas endophytica TaxID=2027858 RepID=A0A917ED48_9HYPH|nr:FAD-dependent oxidoreductase [Aureimonas endophytica]GGE24025.1 pyridine nucleotide-disulfide oxidoreductase [Aureimonas endophytica]